MNGILAGGRRWEGEIERAWWGEPSCPDRVAGDGLVEK
jgi:hypothetical protein